MSRVDRVSEVGSAGVRGQREVRVDSPRLGLVVIVLEAIGEEDSDHVLDLLLGNKVQLQLVEEEVGDELEHLRTLVVSREPTNIFLTDGIFCRLTGSDGLTDSYILTGSDGLVRLS